MIHVAVADDHAATRSALQQFLEQEPGFRWAGDAADGEQAIELVARSRVDVLILDLRMRGLDGLDALPRLRIAAPHLRIVVLSAYPATSHAEQARALGASLYLEKAKDLNVIAEALRKTMDLPAAAYGSTTGPSA